MDVRWTNMLNGALMGAVLGGIIGCVVAVIRVRRLNRQLRQIPCPQCGQALGNAKPRKRTLEQVVWGGFTCPACDCDVDRKGNERLVHRSKLTSVLTLTGLMLGLLLALFAYFVALAALTEQRLDQRLQAVADEVNKTVPKQIDSATRLDRAVAGPGKTLSYVYTVNRALNDADKKGLTESVSRKSLATPEMQWMYDAGVTVWYKYNDPAGKPVLEIPVKR